MDLEPLESQRTIFTSVGCDFPQIPGRHGETEPGKQHSFRKWDGKPSLQRADCLFKIGHKKQRDGEKEEETGRNKRPRDVRHSEKGSIWSAGPENGVWNGGADGGCGPAPLSQRSILT